MKPDLVKLAGGPEPLVRLALEKVDAGKAGIVGELGSKVKGPRSNGESRFAEAKSPKPEAYF